MSGITSGDFTHIYQTFMTNTGSMIQHHMCAFLTPPRPCLTIRRVCSCARRIILACHQAQSADLDIIVIAFLKMRGLSIASMGDVWSLKPARARSAMLSPARDGHPRTEIEVSSCAYTGMLGVGHLVQRVGANNHNSGTDAYPGPTHPETGFCNIHSYLQYRK